MYDYIQGHFTHEHDHKHDHKHTVMKNTITVDRDQVIANYYNMLQALAEYMEVNAEAIQVNVEATDRELEDRERKAEEKYQKELSVFHKNYPSIDSLKNEREDLFTKISFLKNKPKKWWGGYLPEVSDEIDELSHQINIINEKIDIARGRHLSLYPFYTYAPSAPMPMSRGKDNLQLLTDLKESIEEKLTVAKYHKSDIEFTPDQIIQMEKRLQYDWVDEYLKKTWFCYDHFTGKFYDTI